jgi:hypothetical protein
MRKPGAAIQSEISTKFSFFQFFSPAAASYLRKFAVFIIYNTRNTARARARGRRVVGFGKGMKVSDLPINKAMKIRERSREMIDCLVARR